MPDNRSRQEKLRAVIHPDSGATDGERRNAQTLLDRMEPDYPRHDGRSVPRDAFADFDEYFGGRREYQWAEGWEERWEELKRRADAHLKKRAEDRQRMRDSAWQTRPSGYGGNVEYGAAFRAYSDALSKMSYNDLMREFAKATGTDVPFGTQSQLCKLKGEHDWVEFGEDVLHHPLKRCVRCGEYNPPRKETKHGP